jgi:hypothetical protein
MSKPMISSIAGPMLAVGTHEVKSRGDERRT